MGATLGRISARLAEPGEQLSTDLIELINTNINPPSRVERDDVHVRAMYIVSDEVNSFGGRFPVEEHQHLCDLLIDSPVIVGHRKDRLPIGRSFHATIVKRQGRTWVKSYFYWLQSAEGSVSLVENIDGGIYKECSIGFTFALPECSICGSDIRTCEHEPLGTYGDEDEQICHFNYRKIERVLETSLVYRGAIPETGVTRELARPTVPEENLSQPLADLSCFEPDRQLLITPAYDGLMVIATNRGGVLTIKRADGGEPLPLAVSVRFDHPNWPYDESLAAHLIAYRGRERLSRRQLERHLENRSGPATRLELKLYPRNGLDLTKLRGGEVDRVGLIRYRAGLASEVDQLASTLKTRDGVRLWTADALPPDHPGYCYQPEKVSLESKHRYVLHIDAGDRCQLSFDDGTDQYRLRLRQFHPARLNQGARFIAEATEELRSPAGRRTVSGSIERIIRVGKSMVMELSGGLQGRFALQAVRLYGKSCWLLYRLGDGGKATAS